MTLKIENKTILQQSIEIRTCQFRLTLESPNGVRILSPAHTQGRGERGHGGQERGAHGHGGP